MQLDEVIMIIDIPYVQLSLLCYCWKSVFTLFLLKACFLDRKVDELDKAISVAARDPTSYGIDEVEIEKRRRWTSTARTQVFSM